MKKCEKCGSANEADVRFCVDCGNELLDTPAHVKKNEQTNAAVKNKALAEKIYCEQCGAANEGAASFCVNCGYNFLGENNLPAQNGIDSVMSSDALTQFWSKLLMSEKMIAIGVVIGFLGGIIASSYALNVFYFVTMGASAGLLYLAANETLYKKMDYSRFQIAIGAYWLSETVYIVFGVVEPVPSRVLMLISSGLILVGGFLLQDNLLKKIKNT